MGARQCCTVVTLGACHAGGQGRAERELVKQGEAAQLAVREAKLRKQLARELPAGLDEGISSFYPPHSR